MEVSCKYVDIVMHFHLSHALHCKQEQRKGIQNFEGRFTIQSKIVMDNLSEMIVCVNLTMFIRVTEDKLKPKHKNENRHCV